MSLVGYEDKLREASALGDMDAIKLIAKSGKVNINHQHKVNNQTEKLVLTIETHNSPIYDEYQSQ